MTIEAAEKEIERLQAFVKEEKKKEKATNLIVKNVDALLDFVPDHLFDCTDDNPYCNISCTRCVLFDIKKNGRIYHKTLVTVSVQATRINLDGWE